MSDGNIDLSKDARALAYSTPLDQINPAQHRGFHTPLAIDLAKSDTGQQTTLTHNAMPPQDGSGRPERPDKG